MAATSEEAIKQFSALMEQRESFSLVLLLFFAKNQEKIRLLSSSWPLNCSNFFLAVEEPLKSTFQVSICSTRCSAVPVGYLPFCAWFGYGCFLNEYPGRFCACFSKSSFALVLAFFVDLGCCWALQHKKNLKNCELVCCPVSCVGLRSLVFIMSRTQFRWPFTADLVGISIELKIAHALISFVSCPSYFLLLFGLAYIKFGS